MCGKDKGAVWGLKRGVPSNVHNSLLVQSQSEERLGVVSADMLQKSFIHNIHLYLKQGVK
jgi:hypothetical protein